MTLYLKNARYIDSETLKVRSTTLAVEPGPEGAIALINDIPNEDERQPEDRVMDCKNRFVTRSFGCGHHHIYSALCRGMPAPPVIPSNFPEVLQYVWWRVDKRLDRDMVEASALAAALQMARRGVTFCIDHHASPFAVEGSLETVARAFERVGIGHLLCHESSNRDGQDIAEKSLAEHDAYLSSGRHGLVGLHASFTVNDDLLAASVDLADKHETGIHIHVAEDAADENHCEATYNKRVAERLRDFGVLKSPKTILGHCVHFTDEERAIVAESPAWVVSNVESNQNNNVGLTGYGWLQNVMLGTDGMHNDMIRSAKAHHLVCTGTEGIGYDEVYRRFRNVHRYLSQFKGIGDGPNNLVILDYDSPTEITDDNFLGHFIFGLEAAHVNTVIAQGRVIVEDRRSTLVDEQEILAFAREQGFRLWNRLTED
ncbi:amidohydrolase family protein [Pseudodesulfovibrio senegalensis]|uniref:Amidohydrolase family protein n=1 Tax=Pseudodesulfovibrio senegalensis TaxID=1721087 RepID=A0A6N6N4H2_9BACT|nr:amidohydrolase family protein [Pseudodesulfovibrio senegalensis]KAB1443130.1 amidohydrolase family protein [Pseudodesulfovibrio senegalensis]